MARVICVHGMGGTAATMAPVVERLRAAGHDATAITLPGHGGTPEGLLGVTWADWLDAVCAAVAAHGADTVVGQSMGAALAFAAAARGSAGSVVAINTLAPDPDAVDGLEWRRDRGTEWIEVEPSAVGEVALERIPIGALLEMANGVLSTDLGAVHVPVLLVTSAHDDVVDPASSDVVADLLGGPVERLLLPGSGHVASMDVDVDLLAATITTRLGRWH